MTNDQANAASLLESAIDLIRHVLIKHETAVMAEFRAIIEAKNHELKLVYAERDAANKKGHEAVLLAMKHEDSAKRANAEVFRLAELLRKADPNWGSPMHLNEGK